MDVYVNVEIRSIGVCCKLFCRIPRSHSPGCHRALAAEGLQLEVREDVAPEVHLSAFVLMITNVVLDNIKWYNVYVYIYIYMYCVYIYIYIERERIYTCKYVYIYVNMYIYIYIYIHTHIDFMPA